MPHSPLFTISNVLLLCYCFGWTCSDNGGWVQAVDNSFSFREPSRSRVRIGSAASTKDVPERQQEMYVERHSNFSVGYRQDVPSPMPASASESAPTAAPTATPSPFTDTQNDRDEHNAWLLQQQYDQVQQYESQLAQASSSTSTTPRSRRNKGILPSFVLPKSLAKASRSFLDATKLYAQRVQGESPTTFWTAVCSVVVFLSWQLLPAIRSILLQFFLASRKSAKRSWGLSLVLSAVSHTSFRHLLVNLFVFLNLSPALTSVKVPSSSWASKTRTPYAGLSKPALWPFLVGGALSGNLLFLLCRPGGSCLGLSGVTCAMLGAYASAFPDRMMRIRLYGVVPVSLRTGTLVQMLLAVSLAGSIFMTSSPICHLGHLGGLLFGLLYYQNVMITGSKQKFPTKLLFGR